jgi:hypothetical protein
VNADAAIDRVLDDPSPFGHGGDWCPWCGADWKQPHREECPEYRGCEYPPGCDAAALPRRRLCRPHYDAIEALFGPVSHA